jgi:plastocyanin
MRGRALLALVALLGITAVACAKKTTTPAAPARTTSGFATATATPAPGAQAINDKGTKDVSALSSVEVEQDTYYFKPTVLTGKAGQRIRIELENESTVEHNFTLESQNVDQDVEKKEKGSVTVTFPPSGSLVFFCKYHRQLGMQGRLVVA